VFLIDTSALIRYPQPEVAARLDELTVASMAATCGVVELQLLGALTDAQIYVKVATLWRAAFARLETVEADYHRAAQVRVLLMEGGQRGVAWPTLVIAAVAERYGVPVVHYDKTFDLIAGVTEQLMDWVVPEVVRPSGSRISCVPPQVHR
jgi:predicted nucleic acid-binding protein